MDDKHNLEREGSSVMYQSAIYEQNSFLFIL